MSFFCNFNDIKALHVTNNFCGLFQILIKNVYDRNTDKENILARSVVIIYKKQNQIDT